MTMRVSCPQLYCRNPKTCGSKFSRHKTELDQDSVDSKGRLAERAAFVRQTCDLIPVDPGLAEAFNIGIARIDLHVILYF